MSNDTKKVVYLTEEGLNKIQLELSELKTIKRPENIKALKEARALGDLSENADYDAARNEQAEIEGRIRELENIIENAVVIEGNISNTVNIGSVIKIKYVDGDDIEEYRIVGSQEADPFNNKISNESPIARAILGSKKGQIVTVESPTGSYKVQIIEISC